VDVDEEADPNRSSALDELPFDEGGDAPPVFADEGNVGDETGPLDGHDNFGDNMLPATGDDGGAEGLSDGSESFLDEANVPAIDADAEGDFELTDLLAEMGFGSDEAWEIAHGRRLRGLRPVFSGSAKLLRGKFSCEWPGETFARHAPKIAFMKNALLASLAACTLVALACGDDSSSNNGGSTNDGAGGSGPSTGGAADGAGGSGPSGGNPSTGGSGGEAPVDPCVGALFCERFDDYADVTDIVDNQEFGPWRAALNPNGAQMNLDTAHVISGTHALHMHIDGGIEAGGRLFANGDEPLFAGAPLHLYGRMMMYSDPNGPSVHWTFFGASGEADPASPAAGRRATYLMSSLPKNDVNTYSFVYGLAPEGNDPFHDCYNQSDTSMPTAQWTCVEFEMDGANRKLRMKLDGAREAAVSVDETGQGCVGDVVPDDSPWYGPAVDEIYVGAWSFHDMVSPLDVWIDDLVVDTKPVLCTPP